jgi:hypothetical protein
MKRPRLLVVLVCAGVFLPAIRAQAQGPPFSCGCLQDRCLCVDLWSPQNGLQIPDTCGPAGSGQYSIEWTIEVVDGSSPLDPHLGLAMISVDLVQDEANPELFDIPPADGVPGAMLGFAPPAGIGNPAGYTGTQVGEAGARNLLQVGGAQNTLGAAGNTMGLDINVDANVGIGDWQVVASGSFDLPTGIGTYVFRMDEQTIMANVLDVVHSPPEHSEVSEIPLVITRGSISFEVVYGGDMNGNCVVIVADLTLFIAALNSTPGAPNWNPLADLNCSGVVNINDFTILAGRYGTQCP